MRKLPKQDLYRVYNAKTKEVHSYGTTLENAKKQITLLNMVDAGVPLKKKGGSIDREATGILRVPLNDTAKNWLDNKVLPLISQTTIRINDARKNSGVGRTQVFGYGNRRQLGFGEYANNRDYPELYKALVVFGSKVVPSYIPWTAIQVNHNYKTKKHIDGNNTGLSLAVSFGDFTGGELVIEDKEYQTRLHPVIFNGALKEHFNRPIKGNRYSLVYFVSAPKNATDEEIEKLHRELLKKNVKSGSGVPDERFTADAIRDFDNNNIVSIPEFNKLNFTLPTYMYKRVEDMTTKDGKKKAPKYRYKLVVPTTKSRNLSSRADGATSVKVERKDVGVIDVEDNSADATIFLADFSPADQAKLREYYRLVKANRGKDTDEMDNIDAGNKQRGFPVYMKKNAEKFGVDYDEDTNTYGNNPKQPKPPKVPKKRGRPKKVKEIVNPVITFPEGEDEELFPTLTEDKLDSRGSSRTPSKKSSASSITTDKGSKVSKSSKSSKSSVKPKGAFAMFMEDDDEDDPFGSVEDVEDYKDELGKFGKGIENKISSNNKMNSWVQYVKEYAAKNGMKYNEALKDPACKAGYKKGGAVCMGCPKGCVGCMNMGKGLVSDVKKAVKSTARKIGLGIIDEAAAAGYADQVLIADAYNQKNLGSQKRYITL